MHHVTESGQHGGVALGFQILSLLGNNTHFISVSKSGCNRADVYHIQHGNPAGQLPVQQCWLAGWTQRANCILNGDPLCIAHDLCMLSSCVADTELQKLQRLYTIYTSMAIQTSH